MAEGDDETGGLGHVHKIEGGHEATTRVMPAHQGLGPGRCPVMRPHDGLVEDLELSLVEGLVQVGDESKPLEGLALHSGADHLGPASSVLLGEAHGQVGVAEQVLGGPRAGVRDGDADADANGDVVPVDVERRPELVFYLPGDLLGRLGHGARLEEQCELVAAEPSQGVAGAHDQQEPVRHRHQELVTGGVTEAVVDGLELIEVQEQHGHEVGASLGLLKGAVDVVEEQHPVGEPGQRVVKGMALDFGGRSGPRLAPPCA